MSELKIRTKGTAGEPPRLARFVPNNSQRLYFDTVCPGWETDDTLFMSLHSIREDVLKARQQGFSTAILAIIFLRTINAPHIRSLVIADDEKRAAYLLEIVQRFYDELPPEKKPPLKFRNRNELYFRDTDSAILIGSVGDPTLGRGLTLNNVHMSERAWWSAKCRDPESVEQGLMESVPAGGCVWRETTANGFNEYYLDRQREFNGESRFVPRFFGMQLHHEYREPVPEHFVRTDVEEAVALRYILDDEQIQWRRTKRRDLREKLEQEYPLSEEEAFLSSGNPYFDRERLVAVAAQLKEDCYLPLTGQVFSPTTQALVRMAYGRGEFKMWEWPAEGHGYLVVGDPSGGLTDKGDSDFCAAHVIDAGTWEQVAVLHGKWEPFIFGKMLAELGYLYNTALVGVLRINHGHAVIDSLLHTAHYPEQHGNGLSGVYFFDPSQITEQVRQTDVRSRQAGWPENSMTKPFMLDKLGEAILIEPGLWVNDPETIKEMLTYVHLPNGRAGGESGSHDDRVSSLALGAALLSLRFERKRVDYSALTPPKPRVLYGERSR